MDVEAHCINEPTGERREHHTADVAPDSAEIGRDGRSINTQVQLYTLGIYSLVNHDILKI